MIMVDHLIAEALKRLDVQTGFVNATLDTPAYYFAEIVELDIRCNDFTEEAAVKTIKSEAAFMLWHEVSKAKEILRRRPRVTSVSSS
jgi:hypothetical protein